MTALVLDSVTVEFGDRAGGTRVALDQVTLTVSKGESVALVGSNGAGKSTILRALLGLVRPKQGEVRVLGMDPVKRHGTLKRVGALLDGSRGFYPRMTCEENVMYFASLKGLTFKDVKAMSLRALASVDLLDRRAHLSQQLSRGMQQRLAIACAVVHCPDCLLLDEPTLGLDDAFCEVLKQVIHAERVRGAAILVSSHDHGWTKSVATSFAYLRKGTLETTSRPIRGSEPRETGFVVELSEPLTDEKRLQLNGVCQVATSVELHVLGDVQALYDVLDVLRPLGIRSISSLTGASSFVGNRGVF
jgi:ABC-2 type transport system ATP-binding protein